MSGRSGRAIASATQGGRESHAQFMPFTVYAFHSGLPINNNLSLFLPKGSEYQRVSMSKQAVFLTESKSMATWRLIPFSLHFSRLIRKGLVGLSPFSRVSTSISFLSNLSRLIVSSSKMNIRLAAPTQRYTGNLPKFTSLVRIWRRLPLANSCLPDTPICVVSMTYKNAYVDRKLLENLYGVSTHPPDFYVSTNGSGPAEDDKGTWPKIKVGNQIFLPVMKEENIVMLAEVFSNLGQNKFESDLITDDANILKRVLIRRAKTQVIKVGGVYALVETSSIFDGKKFLTPSDKAQQVEILMASGGE
ncbi:ubiquitin-specific protease 27 [Striga asiatica]|uniref:Ubiquitin-specific protease 27 n=1 Tax=Striga asiatica TaxID=4170 RepID=A0A5A7RGQ1_STRAF|nr:ubiquitin-specific protease 27 [Striga asiatica]